MGYVGKVTAGGATHLVGSTLYGTCATAADTVAKVVTCSDFTTLITGITIHVKFTYTNTASSPTLNVNSTGAKAIKMYGTTAVGTDTNSAWYAGAVVSFTYDGTNWLMNDHRTNTDTNTKVTKASNHYTPAADTAEELSASASGATAAWSIDVVKGVQLQRDAKGHVTGVTVTSGKIPANPNTDTKVTVSNTDPTASTTYYPVWYTATSGTGGVNANDGLVYTTKKGTTSVVGEATLKLGNNIRTSTAGNKAGELKIYSSGTGGVSIQSAFIDDGTMHAHIFPGTGGTVLNTGTTSFTQTLGSGTKIGTITINGTSTDLYCETNTDTDTKVKQTATDSTNANYELLFSATADNTTRTEGARKSSYLHYNPKTKTLTGGDSTYYYQLGANTIGPCFTLTCKDGETNPVISLFTENSSGGVVRSIQLSSSDIDCSNKWDGTHTSLKDTLANKLSLSGGTLSGNLAITGTYSPGITLTRTNSGGTSGPAFYCKNYQDHMMYMFCNDTTYGLFTDSSAFITRTISDSKMTINATTYTVSNAANFRSAIGAAASSSRLTKTNIKDLTETEAKKLLNVDVKSFDYKEAFINTTDVHRDKYYGVIAEEVINEIPYVVNVPDDYDESKIDETKGLNQSLLTVDYDKFVPYLIKMVQIQQKEINKLKDKLEGI